LAPMAVDEEILRLCRSIPKS